MGPRPLAADRAFLACLSGSLLPYVIKELTTLQVRCFCPKRHGVATRTALEASRGYRFQRVWSLQPSLEDGLRRDGIGACEHARDYRLGYGLGLIGGERLGFELGLEGTRRGFADGTAPDHVIMVRARWAGRPSSNRS